MHQDQGSGIYTCIIHTCMCQVQRSRIIHSSCIMDTCTMVMTRDGHADADISINFLIIRQYRAISDICRIMRISTSMRIVKYIRMAIPSCDMHPHVLWCNLKSVVFMIYKGKSDFNRSLCSVTFALREKLKSCGDFPSPPQKVQPLLRNQISMNIIH